MTQSDGSDDLCLHARSNRCIVLKLLTEEITDVEAVPGGPVVVGLVGWRRRLRPPSRLTADNEHLRVPRCRRDAHEEGGGENGAYDECRRERNAGTHCLGH